MDKRKAYREKREAQLQEWAAKLDTWQARTKKAKAEVKIRSQEEMEELQQRIGTARARLRELRDAGGGAWEDLKAGVDEAFRDLKRAFQRASSKFR